MKNWLTGERILAAAFAVMGLFFALEAGELRYMDELAPGPGFLPFWLGLVLAALVVVFVFSTRRIVPEGTAAASRKVLAVSVGLVACIVLVDWFGFALGIGVYLVYLVRAVEKRSWACTAGLAAGTTLVLYLIFRVWLSVPLPEGPWGF